MSKPREFNFRQVMHRVGIPSCNSNNWEIGHKLAAYMASVHGIEPNRILTEKTDPNPSVNAPHCICHYPSEHFEEACGFIRAHWRGREQQQDLFD